MTKDELLSSAPENFVIRSALDRCYDVVQEHNNILCSCSGGADSDVMVDMLCRCGAKEKTDFVFFDTGIEYAATKEHLDELEQKYSIQIRREKAVKPVPLAVKEYGQPFWSKFVSEMIHRLQLHDFKWEDRPFEELILEYPKCKTALEWWCNVTYGKTSQYAIGRSPMLKEFMVKNPPAFKISSFCCEYAKKKVAKRCLHSGQYDLNCTGVRQSENGIRSASFKTCFDEGNGKVDQFRPVFWLRDNDREEYCEFYGVTHSRCYTEYGLLRTGCFGCPYAKRFEDELRIIETFEPKLYLAANNIFRESYAYTRAYLKFREEERRGGEIHEEAPLI